MSCVVTLEHNRVYICCRTLQDICCSSHIPVPGRESPSSGSTHVLQGRAGRDHKDVEVRAHGVSERLSGGALHASN